MPSSTHPARPGKRDTPSSSDHLDLRLALALGPGRERALPWPTDLDRWFRETWKNERQRHARWSHARRPNDLLTQMSRLAQRLDSLGASCLFLDDPLYPAPFRLLKRPPPLLFYRGTLPPADRRAVAVVGSRAAYRADMKRARNIGQLLAAAKFLVVSGGALGIDAAAHEGALEAVAHDDALDNPTVAILGSGLGELYPPRNRPLFERIVAAGGCLLSPYLPDEPGKAWHFPARNTLLAALGELTVIVAAGERSGALDTAQKALKLDRPLAAFPHSPGCRHLIATRKATSLSSAEDVIALLEGTSSALPSFTSEERLLLAALDRERSTSIDDLATRLHLSVGRATLLLLNLELRGIIFAEAGGRYRRLITIEEEMSGKIEREGKEEERGREV